MERECTSGYKGDMRIAAGCYPFAAIRLPLSAGRRHSQNTAVCLLLAAGRRHS